MGSEIVCHSSNVDRSEVVDGELVDLVIDHSACGGRHYVVDGQFRCCCGDEHDMDGEAMFCCRCSHFHDPSGSCPEREAPCGSYLCCVN